MEDSSAILTNRLASGDPASAQAVVDRYVGRLLALVQPRISRQLARRIDAEDIAQSAFRSFFRRAGQGQLVLGRGAPLWRLLSAIALKKLLKQAEYHLAAKRSPRRESAPIAFGDEDWLAQSVAGREPDPAETAALADELAAQLAGLEPLARTVIELRLLDYSQEDIAAQIQKSERTVRRILADVQQQWQVRRDR